MAESNILYVIMKGMVSLTTCHTCSIMLHCRVSHLGMGSQKTETTNQWHVVVGVEEGCMEE